MVLMEGVQVLLDEVTKVRRDLHKIPESGYAEYKTSEYICNYLMHIGIKFEKNIAQTGVVAKIEGKGQNKQTIAFRADMDALSLNEMTNATFASEHDGFMHGCGHDGHMTMLLIFAKYLYEHKEALNDDVVFIFQPAEEGPGGAEVMIQEGLMTTYKIDEIFGIHLHPEFEQGTIAISAGPVMAMTGEFDIDIKAKSGHGAMPHTAIDGIMIASHLVNQFQTIISRNINPTEAGVITIGRIEGGERRNIIAENVRLEGTTRAFSEDTYELIRMRMAEICKGLALSFDCEIEFTYRTMYPPVVNHVESVESFKAANTSLTVVHFPPQMIAEDFSYYLREVKGAFVFLGTKNQQENYVYPLHNSKFNFDESALLYGIQSYINLLKHKGNNV